MDNSAQNSQQAAAAQQPAPTLQPTSTPPPAGAPQMAENSAHAHLGMLDTFENILMFISLYIFSTFLVLLINFYVDKWIPSINPSASSSYYASTAPATEFILFASSIIVSYPFFAFLFLNTTKRIKNNPELRSIKSRRSLIYITLTVTFVTMLINFISTVVSLLSGNISLNFVLHFLVILIVAGSIFVYYLSELKHKLS